MNDFKTKKKFGQNFLTDKNLLSAICRDAEISHDDEVLEIGAGMGALTCELSKSAKKVVAFEIDNDLKDYLISLKLENVKFNFKDVLQAQTCDVENEFEKNFKVVANLPYYITSPIIFKFLKSEKITSMTVMVQKEVGERMVASQKCKDYGVLSVCLAVLGDAKITRIVGRNMFKPVPNVDSCIVKIDLVKKYNLKDYNSFFEFVKKIFSMRRKTLLNNLNKAYEFKKDRLIEKLGEDILKNRAESFSPKEIVDIFNKLF